MSLHNQQSKPTDCDPWVRQIVDFGSQETFRVRTGAVIQIPYRNRDTRIRPGARHLNPLEITRSLAKAERKGYTIEHGDGR